MTMAAKIFDRRWYWLLITPAVLYWLIPLHTRIQRLQDVQNNQVVMAIALGAFLILNVWLYFRQKFLGEVSDENEENWWLDLLRIVVLTIFGLIAFDLVEKIYDRIYLLAYALQITAVFFVAFSTWRVVYSPNVKKS